MDEDEYLNADASEFETDEPAPEEKAPVKKEPVRKKRAQKESAPPSEESTPPAPIDDGPPPPPTDHIVHVYEHGKFTRSITRPFTAEDAEAFASDYNKTAKPYGRFAIAGKEKARVKKTVPWPPGA